MVVLRLNDVRSIVLAPGEDVHGVVSLAAATPSHQQHQIASLTRHEPARFQAGADSILVLEIRAVANGAVDAARVLGEVRLPLEHVAKRCGRGLYWMWFPLSAPWHQRQEPGTPQDASPPASQERSSQEDIDSLEHFDRALRNAARDPRWPMVCLSLCPTDSPEAEQAVFEADYAPEQKALHFNALLHSHAQHARLLQALYRICRSAKQQQQLERTGRGDRLLDSWASPEACAAAGLGVTGNGSREDGGYLSQDIGRLQGEIASTTTEANLRINQASDAIRTLRERLASRQAEHDRMRRDTQRAYHDAELLEVENERLELTLQRGVAVAGAGAGAAAGGGGSEPPEEEAKRIRRDITILKEQKEALMLILEDLYGAVGKGGVPAELAAGGAGATQQSGGQVTALAIGSGGLTAENSQHVALGNGSGEGLASGQGLLPLPSSGYAPAAPAQQAWTNLLPRPSELLFDSHVLDD